MHPGRQRHHLTQVLLNSTVFISPWHRVAMFQGRRVLFWFRGATIPEGTLECAGHREAPEARAYTGGPPIVTYSPIQSGVPPPKNFEKSVLSPRSEHISGPQIAAELRVALTLKLPDQG